MFIVVPSGARLHAASRGEHDPGSNAGLVFPLTVGARIPMRPSPPPGANGPHVHWPPEPPVAVTWPELTSTDVVPTRRTAPPAPPPPPDMPQPLPQGPTVPLPPLPPFEEIVPVTVIAC